MDLAESQISIIVASPNIQCGGILSKREVPTQSLCLHTLMLTLMLTTQILALTFFF